MTKGIVAVVSLRKLELEDSADILFLRFWYQVSR